MKKYIYIIPLLTLFAFVACDDDKDGDDPDVKFDQTALLANTGNNIILPAFELFQTDVNELHAAMLAFNQQVDSANLVALRSDFATAYESWQGISFLAFGPAMNVDMRVNLNTFPTDTAKIQNNISSGTTNLDVLSFQNAKGFPALDYLLFSKNIAQTVQYFTAADASKRKAYLQALLDDIKQRTDAATNGWKASGDNYINTFSSNTGTDVGSSVGLLINNLNQHYERNFRDGKIGIPSGVRSLGIPLPEQAEAYHSGISKTLVQLNLSAMEKLYKGNSTQAEGVGLDDYLTTIGAQELNNRIVAQFSAAKMAVDQIQGSIPDAIGNQPTVVDNAYQEIQKLITLIKVDMPSRLGVLITYQDNDGD